MERYYLRNFLREGQEINYHWFSGKSVLHSHDYFEIIIATKGVVTNNYLDKTTVLNVRDVILIKPNMQHDPSSTTYSQHFNISFSAKTCEDTCNLINSNLYSFIKNTKSDFLISLDEEVYKHFLFFIKKLLNNDIKTNDAIIKILLHEVLFFIYITFFKKEPQQEKNLPAWFNEYLLTLSKPEVFTKKLSDIYSLSGYSQSVIIKYFKQYLKITPVDYMMDLKIQYACNLLNKSNMTILTIANECGYSSLSRFITLFRNKMGISPTEYRKKCQTLQVK